MNLLWDEVAYLVDSEGFNLSYADIMAMPHVDRITMVQKLTARNRRHNATIEKARSRK